MTTKLKAEEGLLAGLKGSSTDALTATTLASTSGSSPSWTWHTTFPIPATPTSEIERRLEVIEEALQILLERTECLDTHVK